MPQRGSLDLHPLHGEYFTRVIFGANPKWPFKRTPI
jgi:hypothetical protein